MRIAIIGSGFTGLSAGYNLSKMGQNVCIFESESKPGGLAAGFRNTKWEWSLEDHYHHLFSNDKMILDLVEEVDHEVNFFRPKTSALVNDTIYQLDSPSSLLSFPGIPLIDRVRTGMVIVYLKKVAKWEDLEKLTAEKFLRKYMGERSWNVIWKPLFVSKFRIYASEIPASWFWARIVKRTPDLGYPVFGFAALAETIAEKITEKGGKILYDTKVESIKKSKSKFEVITRNNQKYSVDKVISTLPTNVLLSITKGLPTSYVRKIKPLKGIGALTLIVSTKEKFFSDGTYWLSVNDSKYPFVAVVEHTNLIDNRNYGSENILYIGNYLKNDDKLMSLSKDELINLYLPYLKKINPKIKKTQINDSWLIKSSFAQPIPTVNYSKHIPPHTTPIDGLYIANMQQVYPWDRGTNYAVELGRKAADLVVK
jgi:protoporphyrinogen oxidase